MIERVTVHALAMLAWADDVSVRQIPFIMRTGLNLTGNDAQQAERQGIQDRFNLRRKEWNLRAIKISPADRATKTRWKVIIQLDPRAGYLERFENEGVHEPFGDRNYLWIPNNAVFRNKIIQAGNPLHPKALKMHRQGTRVVGEQSTYMIRGPKGPMVIQRLGQGQGTKYSDSSIKRITLDSFGKKRGGKLSRERKKGTQVLYVLRERVSVPLKLEFGQTISKAVQKRAEIRFREAIAQARATAR